MLTWRIPAHTGREAKIEFRFRSQTCRPGRFPSNSSKSLLRAGMLPSVDGRTPAPADVEVDASGTSGGAGFFSSFWSRLDLFPEGSKKKSSKGKRRTKEEVCMYMYVLVSYAPLHPSSDSGNQLVYHLNNEAP